MSAVRAVLGGITGSKGDRIISPTYYETVTSNSVPSNTSPGWASSTQSRPPSLRQPLAARSQSRASQLVRACERVPSGSSARSNACEHHLPA